MGRKISVDSATMMNKGLELIEACELFGLEEGDIDIVVHPQSVVHSMVEYVDGSVLAQMANPDMKVPIAYALGWPQRVDSGAASLDLFAAGRFEFEPPNHDRFPALGMARNAAKQGGTAPAILNAANEVAVEAFLRGEISFNRIMELVTETMDKVSINTDVDLEMALQADQEARRFCATLVSKDCKLAL
jgi:1-deoxy-D-xylulose-5-phosphate reductoisomerase